MQYLHIVNFVITSWTFGAVAGANALICDSNNPPTSPHKEQLESMTKSLFLTFHCYCTRKDVSLSHIVPFWGQQNASHVFLSLIGFLWIFSFSDTMPWCGTWRYRYCKSINRICFLCCNWDSGSWSSDKAWFYEVIAPICLFIFVWCNIASNIKSYIQPELALHF